MRRFVRSSLSRYMLFGAVLSAFALRALIPAGYMPAHGTPFAFEICPVGFPAQLMHHVVPAQHDHDGTGIHPAPEHPASTADSCVFASTSGGAIPAPDQPIVSALFVAERKLATPSSCAPSALRKFCVQQPRAPPDLA